MTSKELLLLAVARKALREGQAQELRRAADLSQSEIAKIVGVRASAVCRWESGVRRPKGAAGLRYARLLETLAGDK
jgi:DNA-binding transcriptional regulator YiaG